MAETVRTASWKRTGLTNVKQIVWSGLDGDDSGTAEKTAKYADKSVHIFGTFGGATVTLYGSNDKDAVEADRAAGTLFQNKTAVWTVLVDPQGNSIAKTAASIEAILENPLYILPVVTGGDGTTDLTVAITGKKTI